MKYNSEMLLRICQADCWGLAIEYVDVNHPNFNLVLQFDHYYAHPRWNLKPGMYSDDGQLSCACAEVIISGPPYTKEKFAKSFFDVFKRDPRPGYAKGFQSLLEEVQTWKELVEKLIPNSDKNGAAMRSVPLGVLDNPEEILRVAQTQASITHNTPGGIISSQAVALTSHYALYDCGPLERKPLLDWMSPYLPKSVVDMFMQPWVGPLVGPAVGIKTAHAAIDIVTTQNSLLDILRRVADIKGDCDTLAAVCFGIASSRMTEPLPAFFENELEPNGKYGVSFLRDLGEQLIRPFYNKKVLY